MKFRLKTALSFLEYYWILYSLNAILTLIFSQENYLLKTILKSNILIAFFSTTFFLSIFSAVPVNSVASTDASPVIKLIEITGNKRIETGSIQARIKSSINAPFSQKTVQKDIKTLSALGYFDDIRVEVEPFEGGIKLIYILKEKPTIRSVDFQGNSEVETDNLREKVTVAPGAIANHALIMDNVENIRKYYESEGYMLAKVIPVIKDVPGNAIALTFQITEGKKVKIKKITIEGNKKIASKKIKKAMKTKERWFLSFLTGSGFYKEDETKTDIERIRELYHSKGYISVVISEPEITLSDDKSKLYINIPLSEGEQYKIAEVSFRGNELYNSTELYQYVETAGGEVFNRTALRSDIDKILELYTEKGYAVADINPLVKIDHKDKFVYVTFSITEGEIFRIGRIDITGNQTTRDKVIRREIRLDEGDNYNSKLMKRSYQRLNNLNYFEFVDIDTKPVVKEKLVDLNVKVKEKLTGMLTVGGGYSSTDKFIVTGEITQGNLFGRGLFLKLKADLSATRTNYYISVKDPWFMDKPISASVSVYNESFEYPDYDKEAIGFSLGLGKEFSEYVGGNIIYNLEKVDIANISDDASSIIIDQEGEKITSSISPSIWRDTRDNRLDPTSGSKNSLSTTFAGLGGDNYFIKTLADSLWYFPFKWDTAFSLRGRAGYSSGIAGKEVPLYERFYVGGIDTVRGLGFGEGGPRDEEGEVIGGEKELIFNAEYIFPIEKNIRLKGVLFFDAGSSFDDFDNISPRPTVGAGVRWMSPFGPIRLEWGFNLSKKDDESSSKIEFAIGGIF